MSERTHLLLGAFAAPIRVASQSGFLSKRIWKEFYAYGQERWQRRQWESLIATGLFRPVVDYGFVGSVITLTDQGKRAAVDLGLDPVPPPPARNLWHDEELIRFALFLEAQGWITRWMTEQEIKTGRAGIKTFSTLTDRKKFPDLLVEWNIPGEQVIWAVELERTRKEFSRYYDMVGAYRGISKIDSVLVIAATGSIEANIKKAQAKMNYPQTQRPMIFATMDQVIGHPKTCELRVGAKCISLEKMARALLAPVPAVEVIRENRQAR
jgi:hypothetical protein